MEFEIKHNNNQILFLLLRCVLCGTLLSDAQKSLYSREMLPYLLELSKKHDISHLIILALKQNDLLSDEDTALEKEILATAFKYEKLNYEYERLCTVLEDACIPFIPLKGAVLRKYYPEPWMRTSCDIDILVHEQDLDKAVSLLTETYGYSFNKKGGHDVLLLAKNSNVQFELHYKLIGRNAVKSSKKVLDDVWKTARVTEKKQYQYNMPDEMFYFYHIAHMAKHFETGGCGIRTFIDLWLLDNTDGARRDVREKLLKQGGLLDFSRICSDMCKIWFEEKSPDAVLQQMENFILLGGVYGNEQNRITVQQQKNGGRLGYALSKIFIPYDVIKFHYPILNKHRWLTPFMEVRRWFKLIFCGHIRRVTRELKYNQSLSSETADATKQFLSDIGL